MLDQSYPADDVGVSRDRPLDVLVVGAGFSGICAAIKLRERGITNFRIYDKAAGIGGTWWDNVYPGAACDVPSHFYCFSFEPNPNWSRLYSPQAEVQAYAEHCVDTYELRPHLALELEIASFSFDESAGLWCTCFVDSTKVWSRFVINGAGLLHKPNWPEIPGREAFGGAVMHTANWDPTFDPAGKKIAVIGSAASAIQAVPALAKTAAHVTLFQRTANFIAPRHDRAYTEGQKRRFARNRVWARLYRWLLFMRLEMFVYPIIRHRWYRASRAKGVVNFMRRAVHKPGLHDALAPDFELGCKRILISDDFYPALNRDNVTLVTAGIDRIAAEGVLDRQSELHRADALVFATGFDIEGQFYGMGLTGANGLSLRAAWKDKIEAYRGVMIAGFPNYFMTTGPNTGVGTTSVIFMIEQTVGWIVTCIASLGPNETVAPSEAAQRAYNDEIQTELSDTVWATGCTSWYKRDDGRIDTLVPYNARRFRREMKTVRRDDLIVRSPAG